MYFFKLAKKLIFLITKFFNQLLLGLILIFLVAIYFLLVFPIGWLFRARFEYHTGWQKSEEVSSLRKLS
jgi:hypothetical protein